MSPIRLAHEIHFKHKHPIRIAVGQIMNHLALWVDADNIPVLQSIEWWNPHNLGAPSSKEYPCIRIAISAPKNRAPSLQYHTEKYAVEIVFNLLLKFAPKDGQVSNSYREIALDFSHDMDNWLSFEKFSSNVGNKTDGWSFSELFEPENSFGQQLEEIDKVHTQAGVYNVPMRYKLVLSTNAVEFQ